MKITENTFIEILGLPEWDDRVLEVLEALELPRPIVEDGEVYAYLSSDKYGVDIMFDYDCITEEQKAMEKDRNLYVSQVSFSRDTKLLLPYGISFSDEIDDVINKLDSEPDTPSNRINDGCGWAKVHNNTPYWLYTGYFDSDLNGIKKLFIRVQFPYKWD